MAALTAARQTKSRASTRYNELGVAASTTIYKGSMLCFDASGYLTPGTSGGLKFAGVALETVDNSSGANGAKTCKFAQDGKFSFDKTGTITQANLGDLLAISDDQTLALALAAATTSLTGDNNDLVWTAKQAWEGAQGELITIEYRDPGANDAVESIVVEGTAIIVNLATGGAGAIASTGDTIKATLAGHGVASAMVTAVDAATDDGSGTVTALSATRLSCAPVAGRLDALDGSDVWASIDSQAL
jgi:hypothetical protein